MIRFGKAVYPFGGRIVRAEGVPPGDLPGFAAAGRVQTGSSPAAPGWVESPGMQPGAAGVIPCGNDPAACVIVPERLYCLVAVPSPASCASPDHPQGRDPSCLMS